MRARRWLLVAVAAGIGILVYLVWRGDVHSERGGRRGGAGGKPRVQADTSAPPPGPAIGSQARAPARTVRVSWRVKGKVVDEAGTPVPGARVRARWIDFREQTDVGNITRIVDEIVSGADGTFEIDAGHDAESTFLVAEAEDHAQTDFHLLDHFAQDWFPELVVSRRHARISGRLTDAATSLPLAGTEVVYSFGGSATGGSVLTDDDGRYSIASVPLGDVNLGAAPSGYAPGKRHVEVATSGMHRADLEVSRGRLLHGVVRDTKSRQGIAGARVWCSFWPRRYVTTDDEGRYRYPGFPVASEEESACVTALAPGHVRETHWLEMTAREGGAPLGLDFPLAPAAILTGRVVDEHGLPIHGARVTVADMADTPVQVRTGADGTFRIDHGRPGKGKKIFGLRVGAPGYQDVETGDLEIERAGEIWVDAIRLRRER